MNTAFLAILIGAVVVVAVAILIILQKRRTATLKGRFGPEYERAVREYGGRYRAEKVLAQRAHRIQKYTIRSLTPSEQQQFTDDWRRTQARFVDDPRAAIREADALVAEVMRVRGYPMSDFDGRAEDLSVDHPYIVRNYRAAHAIALAQQGGRASTEDLRQGMVLYRELFDELLETHPAGMPEQRR